MPHISSKGRLVKNIVRPHTHASNQLPGPLKW